MEDYKIVKAHDAEGLTKAVNLKRKEGWEIIGSHQVNVERIRIERAATMHVYVLAYTQTMIKR